MRCYTCRKPARIRLVAHSGEATLSVPSCFDCRAQLSQRITDFRWGGQGADYVSELSVRSRCSSCAVRPRRFASWRTTIDERDNVNCVDCGTTLRVIDG